MRVVVRVTSAAVFRRIAKYLRLMAGRTFSLCMFTEKWEPRQVVIEEYVFLPGFFIVAVIAHDALRSAVRVLVFMTLAATGKRLHFIEGLDVAS